MASMFCPAPAYRPPSPSPVEYVPSHPGTSPATSANTSSSDNGLNGPDDSNGDSEATNGHTNGDRRRNIGSGRSLSPDPASRRGTGDGGGGGGIRGSGSGGGGGSAEKGKADKESVMSAAYRSRTEAFEAKRREAEEEERRARQEAMATPYNSGTSESGRRRKPAANKPPSRLRRPRQSPAPQSASGEKTDPFFTGFGDNFSPATQPVSPPAPGPAPPVPTTSNVGASPPQSNPAATASAPSASRGRKSGGYDWSSTSGASGHATSDRPFRTTSLPPQAFRRTSGGTSTATATAYAPASRPRAGSGSSVPSPSVPHDDSTSDLSPASSAPEVSSRPSATPARPRASSSGDGDLPDGWEEVVSSAGQKYFYHRVTRISRWEKPDASVAADIEARIRAEKDAMDDAIQRRRAEMVSQGRWGRSQLVEAIRFHTNLYSLIKLTASTPSPTTPLGR